MLGRTQIQKSENSQPSCEQVVLLLVMELENMFYESMAAPPFARRSNTASDILGALLSGDHGNMSIATDEEPEESAAAAESRSDRIKRQLGCEKQSRKQRLEFLRNKIERSIKDGKTPTLSGSTRKEDFTILLENRAMEQRPRYRYESPHFAFPGVKFTVFFGSPGDVANRKLFAMDYEKIRGTVRENFVELSLTKLAPEVMLRDFDLNTAPTTTAQVHNWSTMRYRGFKVYYAGTITEFKDRFVQIRGPDGTASTATVHPPPIDTPARISVSSKKVMFDRGALYIRVADSYAVPEKQIVETRRTPANPAGAPKTLSPSEILDQLLSHQPH